MSIQSIFDLFKKGNEVVNPAAVKKGQITSNNILTVITALLAIASSFGYDFNIDKETLVSIVSGLSSLALVVNSILTVISSKKAGL
jgi:hypothetical protein